MNRVWRTALGAVVTTGLALASLAAQADVVARWIQLAPGSSSPTPTLANFGDAPTSATNTVLARAIISDVTQGCPAATLDHSIPLTMTLRFDPATLTGTSLYPDTTSAPTPGTAGATNGQTGYPQYFINGANKSHQRFEGVNGGPVATSAWSECEAIVPPGHTVATIGGMDLKLPVANPQRLLVIADTGCRLNGALATNGANQQDCQDSAAFPLKFLSAAEANTNPDLVVLVGDMFYRDTTCENTFTGCDSPDFKNAAYETWGDTFDSWNADLFFPANTLLSAAPWVIVRGNHESCGRGARGWFALLDPHPYSYSSVVCAKSSSKSLAPKGTATAPTVVYNGDFTPTYLVPIASNANLIVHDSSFANDGGTTQTAQDYDAELTGVLASLPAGSVNVFTTHKPTFGLGYGNAVTSGSTVTDNFGDFTEQQMFFSTGRAFTGSAFASGKVPPSIGLLLSGHVHAFQFANFADAATYPPQLVVGVSGSLLDPDLTTGSVPAGITDIAPYDQTSTGATTYQYSVNHLDGTLGTAALQRAYSHTEFGFATLDARSGATSGKLGGFLATIYKASGGSKGRCLLDLGMAQGHTRGINCNF